jgi:hypothetical protein
MHSRAGQLCAEHPDLAHLTVFDVAVFCAMASFVGWSQRDYAEPCCYAAQETIAKRAHVGLRAVAKSLTVLQALGLVVHLGKQVRTVNGHAHTTIRWGLPLIADSAPGADKGEGYADPAAVEHGTARGADKGTARGADKGTARGADIIKSSVSDPRGAKTDDDRGSTPTPRALTVERRTLRAIIARLPDITTDEEAADYAAEVLKRAPDKVHLKHNFVMADVKKCEAAIAAEKISAARAKRDLRLATEQETAEADRLEQQRRKRAEQLAQEHEKANALERYRVEAAARADAERVEDNKRRATLGLPLLEPGESVYGNRKAQP